MIYEPPVTAHAMTIDHQATVQMQAIMMCVIGVPVIFNLHFHIYFLILLQYLLIIFSDI